ncbi:CBS domain-containing protein [Enhydrobacter sp.]|jgi:CBS domain-containing protein|uniref:CBS domain-containing protein n=1 Tax=Enhydrobacter sp. TaxID=1894999 RepID=UPI002605DFF0|nr:CBS domain-containing protein [Enhydrobacter sp.]WIM09196.1 MAG: CBS domain protein [Enhydrobacter sp.]
MQVSDVMTRGITTVSPYASVCGAARTMDRLNVGALPVCSGERLVGIVTDRDITVRSTAAGDSPHATRVCDVMSDDVCWCYDDTPVDAAEDRMGRLQVRRLPVVDRGRRLVGMVSLGDLVTCQSPNVEGTLRAISEPSEPDRGGGPMPLGGRYTED